MKRNSDKSAFEKMLELPPTVQAIAANESVQDIFDALHLLSIAPPASEIITLASAISETHIPQLATTKALARELFGFVESIQPQVRAVVDHAKQTAARALDELMPLGMMDRAEA